MVVPTEIMLGIPMGPFPNVGWIRSLEIKAGLTNILLILG